MSGVTSSRPRPRANPGPIRRAVLRSMFFRSSSGLGLLILLGIAGVAALRVLFPDMRDLLESIAEARRAATTGASPEGGIPAAVPPVSDLDVVYALLQLLTFSAPPLEVVPIPLSIQIARVAAPLLGVLAIVATVTRVIWSTVHVALVRGWHGHEVRIVDEATARSIGLTRGRPSISLRKRFHPRRERPEELLLVLPEIDDETRRLLHRCGLVPLVVPYAEPARGALANAVSGARRVYVDLGDDVRTLDYARAAATASLSEGWITRSLVRLGRRSPEGSRAQRSPMEVVAVVQQAALCEIGTGLENLRIQSRGRRVALGAISSQPPTRVGLGPLNLVVVGDGPDLLAVVGALGPVVAPAEDACIRLLVPAGTQIDLERLPPEVSRLVEVDADSPAERLAEGVRRVQIALWDSVPAKDGRLGLSRPIYVHARGELALLLAAKLSADATLPLPIVVIPDSSNDPGRSGRSFSSIGAGTGEDATLRVIGQAEVSTLAVLDGFGLDRPLLDLFRQSIRDWEARESSAPRARGAHPAWVFMPEGSPRAPISPEALRRSHVEAVLAALNAGGFRFEVTSSPGVPQRAVLLGGVVDAMEDEPDARGRSEPIQDPARLLWRSARLDLAALALELLAKVGIRVHADAVPSLDEGRIELMARRIHDAYLAALTEDDRAEANASHVQWAELSSLFAESSREQARRAIRKLPILGLKPTTEVPASSAWPPELEPSPEAIEVLSRYEHERWSEFMVSRGYRYHDGPRDHDRLTHSNLKPYDDLSEGTREKDRRTVASLPDIMAAAGLGIALDHAGPRRGADGPAAVPAD